VVVQFWLNASKTYLSGVRHTPTKGKRNVAALLISGFPQSMCDIDYFMSRLARKLCEKGNNVFQIDPIGIGDSSGLLEEVNCKTIKESLYHGITYIQKQGFNKIFCISRGLPATLFATIAENLFYGVYIIGLNPYYGRQKLDLALLTKKSYELMELYQIFTPKQVNLFLNDIGAKTSNLSGQRISYELIKDIMEIEPDKYVRNDDKYNNWIFSFPLGNEETLSENEMTRYTFPRDAKRQNNIINIISNYVEEKVGESSENTN
jgi:hypothetical protein